MADFTVYKCDHEGTVVWHYPAAVVQRTETSVCLAAVFDRDESDLGAVVLRRGDVFTEWFYSDRWYNIFRIEDIQTSLLKGWYCNITRPARILEDGVYADDLALDIFVMPNGNIVLLDEDEFTALDLPAFERIAALRAVEYIRQAVAERSAPFHEIRG